jgi:glycosyltransferase involved in cell wall biosynthesis
MPDKPPERAPGSPVRIAYVTTVALSVRLLLANQLKHLKSRGFDVTVISAGGDDLSAVQHAGIRHIQVPFTRRIDPVRDIIATWRLWRVIRRERFAIVHTHQPKPGLFGQIAARLAGTSTVINTIHGFMFTERSSARARFAWVWIERLAARCSDLVLCVSGEDADTAVRERICGPERVVCIGGGIDVRRFTRDDVSQASLCALREELGLQPTHRVIGFVGRLVREKGIAELLEAFRVIRAAVPEAVLLLVGPHDPDKRDAIAPELLDAANPSSGILSAGYRHDMPGLYALMDVFVLPSHREGLPQTLMEACAMGLPIVTTDVRGCREVVADGQTGVVVPPGDSAAIAAAVLRLLQDAELAARLGRNAMARARAQFDERTVLARLDTIYDRLLQRSIARRSTWLRPEGGS